jgi:hypothetical protein
MGYEKHLSEQQKTNIKNGFSHLKKRWLEYWAYIDPKLRDRIAAITYHPKTTKELSPLERVPWDHITLAGMRVKDYTIKKARYYQSGPATIIPNWVFTDEDTISTEDQEKR